MLSLPPTVRIWLSTDRVQLAGNVASPSGERRNRASKATFATSSFVRLMVTPVS
jgi:hypothetical protein